MYIPKSHKINDKLIKRKRVKLKNNPIKKFSNGHKLGFFYSPKKIISGLNLDNQKKMIIPNKSYSFFSSMLVHGNGKNLILITHYSIITAITTAVPSSGEIVIADKNFKVLGTIQTD